MYMITYIINIIYNIGLGDTAAFTALLLIATYSSVSFYHYYNIV